MTYRDICNETETPALSASHLGHITGLNTVFTRRYGWTETDLLGQPLPSLAAPPDDDILQQALARLHLSGPTPADDPVTLRLRLRHQDGRHLPATLALLAEPDPDRPDHLLLATLIRPA